MTAAGERRIVGELTAREALRKLIHVAYGGVAFTVVFLGPLGSVLLALLAVVWNAFLLPRLGGRWLWRPDEEERGVSWGIVLYPVVVAVLLVAFWRRPEVAAAAWGLLAFGDGMAPLVGGAAGGRGGRLPWNPRKTWAGSLAYVVFGTLGAASLLAWTLRFSGEALPPWPFLVAAAFAAALFAAFLESQPLALDDNLAAPLVAALVLLGVLDGRAFWTGEVEPRALFIALGLGILINLGVGVLGWRAGAIDLSGLFAGLVLGTAIYASVGGRGFLLLVAFVVLGTAATRAGWERKAALHLHQEGGGRRSARHAVANAGVPAIAAVFAATTPQTELYLVAFVAALASALSDTLSSEVGQAWGERTVMITTLRPARRGVDGGVTPLGSLAGLAGAFLLSGLGFAFGYYGVRGAVAVAAAGFVGNLADSVLGATLERRGLLDNEAVNFLSAAVAAVASAGLYAGLDALSSPSPF